MEYRAVKLRGEFLHDKELYIGPRSFIQHEKASKERAVFGSRPKSGYLVVTPFKLEGREYVFKTIANSIFKFNFNVHMYSLYNFESESLEKQYSLIVAGFQETA